MQPNKYNKLPKNVKRILDSFNEDKSAYNECARIVAELNQIGFTAEYYLDGVIYNVIETGC